LTEVAIANNRRQMTGGYKPGGTCPVTLLGGRSNELKERSRVK